MTAALHNQKSSFDFSTHFGGNEIKDILETPSKRKNAQSALITLMNIDAIRAYIAHTLTDHNFIQKELPKFQKIFSNFIDTKILDSAEITQGRITPAPKLRDASEHSLSTGQFAKIKHHINENNEVMQALYIIHALTESYLKDLQTYINSLPDDYRIFGDLYEINTFLQFFDKNAFAMELSPVIINGLPEDKKNGKNLTKEDWVTGLKHTFDESINTFQTSHGVCPFSKIIRHILATTLIEHSDGTLSVSPEASGGALPVFLIDFQNKHREYKNTSQYDKTPEQKIG